MPLTPGTRIGPYEITAPLGAGGMGEVYRARDTKLNRDVALKVLPDLVADDPDRRARFEREAQTLAALNHPNIAQIYGAEEGSGALALVMELVDGPTLAEVIASRPRGQGLPANEAIRIAAQVADALDAAHTAGIVHRDLKPANIKVRADGVVKVLDFGLARMISADPLASASADSPTVVSPAVTAHGVILGTAAYMAPEQARGKVADARSDLWAFGVVLHEMLTGAPLFQGKTVSDVLASVLRDTPTWDTLPPDTPARVRRLLRRCLEKDPQRRLRNAGDARLELVDDEDSPVVRPVRARVGWRAAVAGALLGGAVVAVIAGLYVARSPRSSAAMLRKWNIPRDGTLDSWRRMNQPAISPDGHRIAYVDGRGLRIRDFGSIASIDVPVAGLPVMPTWSPDGGFVVFVTERPEVSILWRVAATGGTPSRVCDTRWVVAGLAVQSDQTIILNLSNGAWRGRLFKVNATGGTLLPFSTNSEDLEHTSIIHLSGLPDGAIAYKHLRGGVAETVIEGGGKPRTTIDLPAHGWLAYSPSGHLIYRKEGERGLWAVPFDLGARRIIGEPFRITEDGVSATISSDGTLAYGQDIAGVEQLAWVDRAGRPGALIGQPQERIFGLRLSPDGTRVAVGGVEDGKTSIWVHDIVRGTKSRVTSEADDAYPVWHPHEPVLAFQRARDWSLWSVNLETGEEGTIVPGGDMPSTSPNWAHDGRTFVFTRFSVATQTDVWMIPPHAAAPVPLIHGPAQEMGGTFSLDGRYVVYQSDEAGPMEVFVREFPGGGGRRQVSMGGGGIGYWSPRGDEIFYIHDQQLMSAAVRTSPTLQIDQPQLLFTFERPNATNEPAFDTLDGRNFVLVRTLKPAQSSVVVVQNWYEEFRPK